MLELQADSLLSCLVSLASRGENYIIGDIGVLSVMLRLLLIKRREVRRLASDHRIILCVEMRDVQSHSNLFTHQSSAKLAFLSGEKIKQTGQTPV